MWTSLVAKLCFNKVILILKWNKMFFGLSLEVLHHYWLLVPRKLDRFKFYLIWVHWLRRPFSDLPFLLVGEMCICMWHVEEKLFHSLLRRCGLCGSVLLALQMTLLVWNTLDNMMLLNFFSWYIFFPFLGSHFVLFLTLVWVLAARCH